MTTATGEGGGDVRPVVLFVLGDARSGTSTLARVLALCGGHQTPRTPKVINEEFLRRHGSSAFDPTMRLQEDGAVDVAERAACIGEIASFLTELPTAPYVVISDPRVSFLSGLWFDAARKSGFDIATVIAVRHPSEVIPSVATQGVPMPEIASAVWLKVNLLAEADTRGVPRVVIEHVNLIEDWRRELDRISAALGINLDARDEDAIGRLLAPKIHQQHHGGSMANIADAEWISVVYEALSAAAHDRPVDEPALDRAFAAYRERETAFRPLLDGFQRLDKMSKHFRPSVMKMVDKARDTANRRRGLNR